jgi:hypothetical protein
MDTIKYCNICLMLEDDLSFCIMFEVKLKKDKNDFLKCDVCYQRYLKSLELSKCHSM